MSISPVSSTPPNQDLQRYFQTRQADLRQLGQSLANGDLAGAQSAFQAITKLGQSGPFGSGNPFANTQREQDFTAIGNALQSGDLAGAQQAFNQLKASFQQNPSVHNPLLPAPSSSGTLTGTGPEIVLNLSDNSGTAGPEQITINIAGQASGGEQISLSVGAQSSKAPQVTFNLGANTNEEIILNLLGPSQSTSGSSSTPTTGSAGGSSSTGGTAGGGLSVSA